MEERSETESWRAELISGLYALREGQFGRAELHFERAYGWAPDQPEVAYALGRERLRRGRVEEAEALLVAAWKGDASLLSAGATLARCLGLYLARANEAHAVLDDAEARHGAHPSLEVTRAELCAHLEEYDRAERRAERALGLCDEGIGESPATRNAARAILARVENARGLSAVELGDPENAIFAFKRAADRDPAWGAPHLNTGAAFAVLGRKGAARAAYERALAADPANALAHYNLALLSAEAGHLADAIAKLERAAELDPNDRAIANALSEARARAGERGGRERE